MEKLFMSKISNSSSSPANQSALSFCQLSNSRTLDFSLFSQDTIGVAHKADLHSTTPSRTNVNRRFFSYRLVTVWFDMSVFILYSNEIFSDNFIFSLFS